MAVAVLGLVAGTTLVVGGPSAFGDEAPGGGADGRADVFVPAEVSALVASTGTADVIVQLADPGGSLTPASGTTDAAGTQVVGERLVAEVGGLPADTEVLPNLGIVPMRVDAAQLAELADSPLVARIEPDVSYAPGPEADASPAASGDEVTDETFAPALDVVANTVHARAAWTSGLTGRGRTVAVLDSGIDKSHPALVGKVLYEACFTNASCTGGASVARGAGTAVPCAYGTQCDHGTHVAGIVAGSNSVYSGMAPGAGLIALQVFSRASTAAECGLAPVPCPRARASDVLAALEEVYAQRANFPGLVAVNMSLSSDSAQVDCSASVLTAAVDKLRTVGIATVVASGNGGAKNGLGVPACIPSTISVGATNPDGLTIWPLSNVSPQLDLVAPGVGVVSPVPGGGFSGTTGTSAAAPVVAGAWALAAEALGTNDVATIEAALKRAATPVTYSGADVNLTLARLDLAALGAGNAPASEDGGVFTALATTDQAPAGATPLHGDVNGDGLEDLVWYNPNGDDLLWTATGGGHFTSALTFDMKAGYRPSMGDFNGDGRDDVLLYGPASAADWVWFSTGSAAPQGQFTGTRTLPMDGDWQSLVGDVNADGRDDVVLYSAADGSNLIWYGTGSRAPSYQFRRSVAPSITGTVRPVAGDFNGDGRSDIFWYGPGDAADTLWLGTTSITPKSQFVVEPMGAVGGDYQPYSGDVNGDGTSDLLLHNTAGSGDELRVSQPDKTLLAVALKPNGASVPALGNFDGDAAHKADIYWYSSAGTPPSVLWLAN